jgi:hypothetical protein
MALTSPALTLAIESLWANIKPTMDALQKLGFTDFSDEAPGIDIKPGATVKVPISDVSKAAEYNDSTNHYRTGGNTSWAEMACRHYLQGFDITGVNVDQGVDAGKMKQKFAKRAGTGVSLAALDAVKTALDGCTASTGVTLPAAASCTLEKYMGLGAGTAQSEWLNRETSVLAVNGTELANIKAKFAAGGIVGTNQELAGYLGFRDMAVVPGMDARICIVPAGSMGFLARVPAYLARYIEAGSETDPDTGLSVGIVIADDQDHNRLIANADLWFGCAVRSAAAAATAAAKGIIKVGTAG